MTDQTKTFEEALSDLVSDYHEADPSEVVSALQLQIYALKEEHPELAG